MGETFEKGLSEGTIHLPSITINGTSFEAEEGMSVLQVARRAGIRCLRSAIMKRSNR